MKDIQKIKEFFSKPVNEAKTAIDMAKEQLDALGAKYEMSGNKFKPFKAIYKPIGKSDDWYDKFDEIVYLFNLESAVKQSMDEAKFMSGMFTAKDFINAKLKNYPKAQAKVNQLINMIGESKFTQEMAEWIWDFFNNASFERPVYEASKKEETEFHKKLDKLVHSTFGKRKGELEEEVDQRNAESYAYQFMQYFDKMSGIVRHNFGDDTRKEFEKIVQDKFSKHTISEEELTEAYVPSNIKEFAKRKGVSSLVNKVAGWAEKVGKRITGGTAIGYNYSTLILDMGYQTSDIYINTDDETIELYGEEVNSFPEFKRVYLENNESSDNKLDEITKKVLAKLKK